MFLDRWIARRLVAALDDAPVEVRLWDGFALNTSVPSPVGSVTVHDRAALYMLLVDGELGFGDGYTDGRITVDGKLLELIETIGSRTTKRDGRRWLADLIVPWIDRWQAYTFQAARRNIHHHYDIGNSFYRLWLDREMLYTCAYFERDDMTLEAAQVAKMDHVCRKLRLRPGDRVVEAGCGWGALALHMARRYGATVKAYNISKEQLAYARHRAASEGLAGRVEFIEDDYRNVSGTYDAFVSVGMLEHVGLSHYRTLGRVIDRCLTPTGRGFLHFIGRNRAQGVSLWTKRRLFPGSFGPSLRQAMEVFEERDFSVLDVENLRLHYARTLEHWLDRFERAADQVSQMFGPQFVRAWRLYLTSSIAFFRVGSMQLFQVTFARGRDNSIPMTRHYLYGASESESDDSWMALTS